MTNNNHYDQGGLRPLVNPGSQLIKKINDSPRIFCHIISKKGKIDKSQNLGPPGEKCQYQK